MNINTQKLEECWAEQKQLLRDALISASIWDHSTGLILSGVDSRPDVVALVNQWVSSIDGTLSSSGWPTLNRYIVFNLQDSLFVLINHGDNIVQGLELKASRANLGIVFNVAIPKAIAKIAEARQ